VQEQVKLSQLDLQEGNGLPAQALVDSLEPSGDGKVLCAFGPDRWLSTTELGL